MNGFSSAKSTTTTVVVAVSSSQIAPSTSTKSTDITNSAMPSRVPLLAAAISFGHANQVNFQEEPAPNTSSRTRKESKSILATGHLQVQSSTNHLIAPNSNNVHQHNQHHSHQRHVTKVDGNAKLIESSCSIRTHNPPPSQLNGRDNKLHYQEEFNKMRERLFRLLSKVPIQVETANNERAGSFSANTSGGSSAVASSSSSSSSQSSGHKKINREPLIIKYYNERALEDILDQHFGCSLIKHNYEHGVPFETHLLKRVPTMASTTSTTTNTTFTNNTSTMIQCNCNPLNGSHQDHLHAQCRTVQPENDRPGDDIGCDQLVYADKSVDRTRMSPNVVYTGAVSQFVYDATDQQANLADWQCPLVVRCDTGQSTPGDSSWPMQPAGAHLDVGTSTKDTASGIKSNPMHNEPNQSFLGARKGTKYNGKLAAVSQRINGGTEASRRHKRASSSSIIAPRLSVPSRSGCKQQSIMVDGCSNGSNQHGASTNNNGLPAHIPAICLTASSIKMITNKANYLQQESLQAVDHFAMNAANGFAPTLQSGSAPTGEIVSDLSSSMSLNAADNNSAFNPPLVDLYQQQYHPNYHHHQQLQHQSHQTSLIYSSPTCGSGQCQPQSGLDAGPGNHIISQSAQQLGSLNQHQTVEVQNESTRSMNSHNFNQQQNRQIYGELTSRDSANGMHLLPVPGEPYYQGTGGYLQPAVELVQQQEAAWQQLCQPHAGQFSDEQVQHMQHQQMIDQQQQQHRLNNNTSNNNGFLTSESYTEHELGFYLNSNGNYLAYGECQPAIVGTAESGQSPAPQHENRMNQQLDNHHHPINRLS